MAANRGKTQVVNWDQWQTLLAVFRSGTYTKAALSLQVNATTVGRRLKLLEQQLGYQLFFRQEGRFYPTHQCEALITHVETASEILRAAEQDSATSESGVVWRDVRMTAPPFLIKHLLAPAVAELTKVHRIRIELMGTGSHVSLSRREADIAIRIEDRLPPFEAEAGQIDAERIGMVAYAVYLGGGFGHFYAYAPEKYEYPINRFTMEVKRQLDVLDRRLAEHRYICNDDYAIADMAIWAWYGQLVLGRLYSAATFLDVASYKNVVRWAKEIDARPAVQRGRMVNRTFGELEMQLHERHDARDFDTKTQDKLEAAE